MCLFSAERVIYSGCNLNQKHVDTKTNNNTQAKQTKETAGKQDSYLEPLFQDFTEI